MQRPIAPALLALLVSAAPLRAQAADPPPAPAAREVPAAEPAAERRALDHADAERWRTLRDRELSRTGAWLAYRLVPADGGDGELRVHAVRGDAEHVIARGARAEFDHAERLLVATVEPERDLVRRAQAEKWKPADRPQRALAILTLASGAVETVERVNGFALPEEDGRWLAWLHYVEPKGAKGAATKPAREPEPAEEAPPEAPPEASGAAAEGGAAEAPPAAPEAEPAAAAATAPPVPSRPERPTTPANWKWKKRADDDARKPGREGATLVVRDLATGAERRFADVLDYAFAPGGRWLAYTTSTRDHAGDGIWIVRLGAAGPGAEPFERTELLRGDLEVDGLAWDEGGTRLAFLSTAGNGALEPQRWALYLWTEAWPVARRVADAGFPGVPAGWGPSRHRDPEFDESGTRLSFGTAPLAEPEPEEVPEADRVVLDVWSWTDVDLQPAQLVRLSRERNRSYLAVVHLDRGDAVVQLATPEVPDVALAAEGRPRFALGTDDRAYRRERSWEDRVREDAWLVDVRTGARRRVLEAVRGSVRLSPGGRWLTWWDWDASRWMALAVADAGAAPVDLGAGIPGSLANEEHDTPGRPRSYGSGGWLADDAAVLLYDRFDVWRCDPEGGPPVCVTDGVGRARGLRLRRVDLDREEPWVDPARPLLLSAFDERTKDAGFFRDRLGADAEPEELLLGPWRFSTPAAAEEGRTLQLTRETFREFGDVWVADRDLAVLRKVSDANPQQAEVRWGEARLVEWTSTDGAALQGILYVPDDFDPERRWPLVTYFYEKSSDRLHAHQTPIPSRSTIRFPFYTSRGYLVFVPDIPYEVGYPGRSALHAVLPGIASLVDEGFVDEARIGVQGHSWGGYQIAWLVTQTDLFACAIAGAPVSNMTSAYGGIRWSSGLSRMFQYERTQSRIGGTLWAETSRYLENSPVFFADECETPLLILHNDEDGAVPWTQGIELFVALRRLGKPCWLLNYNGEQHGLVKYAHKRDYAIRMQQFLDHWLKDAPPPVWMAHGIPAVEKERTLGLDLVEPAGAEGPDAPSTTGRPPSR